MLSLLAALLVSAPIPAPARSAAPVPGPAATVAAAAERARALVDDGADPARLAALGAELFDCRELARRSLGRRWARLAPPDRDAVAGALRALLEARYLGKVKPGAAGAFQVRRAVQKGGEATVFGSAGEGERAVPVELRLSRGKDGRWRAYDAVVAGVGLLDAYSEQLPQLLDLGGAKRIVAQLEAERVALAPRR